MVDAEARLVGALALFCIEDNDWQIPFERRHTTCWEQVAQPHEPNCMLIETCFFSLLYHISHPGRTRIFNGFQKNQSAMFHSNSFERQHFCFKARTLGKIGKQLLKHELDAVSRCCFQMLPEFAGEALA